MAKVIGVHGTFAHVDGKTAADNDPNAEKQWWEAGSEFEAELKQMVAADNGTLEYEEFEWSGDNSERARRNAGRKLMEQTRALEAEKSDYVLVGHSHGGSVISSALQESIARRKPMNHLRRWLSVGTPFLSLRKEYFLFTRIPLPAQAVYVALLLFVVMFLLPLILGMFADEATRERYMGVFALRDLGSLDSLATLGLTTLIISSVFILFYIFLLFVDRRRLHMHSRGNIRKARKRYGDRWLGLTHEDDEAVQGLRSLRSANFEIFNKNFFVPVFTAVAVFALPLAYLILIFTPSAMVSITEHLKTNVYQYDASKALVDEAKTIRDEVRKLRRDMRGSGLTMRACLQGKAKDKPSAALTEADAAKICNRWRRARMRYNELRKEQPNLRRTLVFEARFLDPETGNLQGDGYYTRVNSWLLFNVLSDGITRTLGLDRRSVRKTGNANAQRRQNSQWRQLLRLAVPALIIPLLFAVSAIVVLFLARAIGTFVSGFLARGLDTVTWRQIRRSALGNDTFSEIAETANDRPQWLETSFKSLPADLSDHVSKQSNKQAAKSLRKFRNAISDLAFADAKENERGIVEEYFTWKELIHSAYFDVPEFRKLVYYAIAQSEGFKPTDKFKSDPDYALVAKWFEELKPVEPATPDDERLPQGA